MFRLQPKRFILVVWVLATGLIPIVIIACSGFGSESDEETYCFIVDYNGTEYCSSVEDDTLLEIITPTAIPASAIITPTMNTSETAPGYTLVAPMFYTQTYLINNDGRTIHSWDITYPSGGTAYLLENGNLLQTGIIEESAVFPEAVRTGGAGHIQLYDWDGELLWEYSHITDGQLQHHDVEPLPNGNILFIVYERKSSEEAIVAGRSPQLMPEERDEIWSEAILEIDPTTNEIVWEWHVWDHLVQFIDPNLPNYGDPADFPQRIDINYFVNFDENVGTHVEWLHANAVDYNAELDQILFSPRQMNEFWIIDHNLTTDETAGEKGDLLFRWGNPEAFGVDILDEQTLFFPHDPYWIEKGLPGEGNILVFNNGAFNVREYSSVLEVMSASDTDGNYKIMPGEAAAAEIVWEYEAAKPETFFSFIMGASQRLPNGNTLITDSFNKRIFEVTQSNEIVWEWFEPNGFYLFKTFRYPEDYPPFIEEM